MPPLEGEGDGSDEDVAAGGGDEEGGGAGANAAQLTRPTPPDEPASNGDVREVRREGDTPPPPRLPGDPTSMASPADTAVDGVSGVGSPLNLGGDARGKGEGVGSDGGATGGGKRAAYSGMASRFGAYVEALGFGGGQGGSGGDVEGAREGEEEEDAQENQMKVMFREQQPIPFELAMLEAMLQEVRGTVKRGVTSCLGLWFGGTRRLLRVGTIGGRCFFGRCAIP